VGKVKIQPLRRDFQAEGKVTPLDFSTALLPTNSATEPFVHLTLPLLRLVLCC
jgi:hypothetical protein